jgi:crossover junction endodeoxyribonuclease RuvC
MEDRILIDANSHPAAKSTRPRILGIDPGLNVTGYAVVEVNPAGPQVCEAGVIRGRNRDSLTHRLAEVH